MVASRKVENPYCRGVGRQRRRGFGALAQVSGRTAIPFLRKYIVPAAKRISADMLQFAAPEFRDVINGRKSFKSAAKSVGKQTLKKQLGEGSCRRKGAVGGRNLAYGRQGGCKQRRVFPTKPTKQSSRSSRNIFTNTSRWSCQTTVFGTHLLWRYLEISEVKSQVLMLCCPCIIKNFIQLPHLMKTA